MMGLNWKRFCMAALLVGLCASAGAGGRLTPLWVYWAPRDILFTPTVAWNGTVYFATADGFIRAVSSAGTLLWEVNPGGLPSAAMALQGDMLYFPTGQGEIAAYGTDGRMAWKTQLYSTLCSTPAVAADGTIYATTVTGKIVAIGPRGGILWSYQTADPIVTPPAVTHTGLVFVTTTKHCYLMADGGVPVAITSLTDAPISPMAIDYDDFPYFWGASGSAWGLSQRGAERWHTGDSGTLVATGASPVASDSNVFLASALGTPPAKTYAVSGKVILGLQGGLAGVVISTGTGGVTATTVTDGSYTLRLENGSYTLTPTLTGYAFTPATQSVTVNNADVSGQNFTAQVFAASLGASAPAESAAGASPMTSAPTSTGRRETSTVTYHVGAYTLSTGSSAWTPLEIGGQYAPALGTGNILFLPSQADQKVYLLDETDGTTVSSLILAGPPKDMVLANTSSGARLVFVEGTQALECFASEVAPDPASPWTQVGAGALHLYRRDDPPNVTLIAPTSGEVVSGITELQATATDDFTNPPSLRFLIDGIPIGNATDGALAWDTTTYPNGTHVVAAQGRDSAGNAAVSQVSVSVNNEVETQTVYADTTGHTFTWEPGTQTRFRVDVSTNGAFSPVLATSKQPGHAWLAVPSWTPSSQTWSKILGSAKSAGSSDKTIVWRVVGETSAMPGAGGFLLIKGISPATNLAPDSASSGTPPVFSWEAEHTGRYQVRISDTADFRVLRMTSKTTKQTWLSDAHWTPDVTKWTRLTATYSTVYWMVISKDPIGRTSQSLVKTLDITP